MTQESTNDFFTRNQPVFDEWKKYREMTANEYAEQFKNLIEYACYELPDEEGDKVLFAAFNLIRMRLNIKIETRLVLPERS